MFRRMRTRGIALWVGLGILVVSALMWGPAMQTTFAQNGKAPRTIIQVFPGKKAIRKALRQANPGDILNIHAGTYNGTVHIGKENLTLQAAGDGPVIIDAQCSAVRGVHLDADGIIVKGLTVRGATEYAISVEGQTSGEVRNNTVENTCEGAEYGVNVYFSGSIKVVRNTGWGWDDAVVYIGNIDATPNGPLVVKKNTGYDSVRGVIIEDSENVTIKVVKNNLHDNTDTGILIHNSDGVLIQNNTVTNNATNGIHLDPPSANNTVLSNTFTGHTFDINNEGSGNCFTGNTYVTHSGPVNPC